MHFIFIVLIERPFHFGVNTFKQKMEGEPDAKTRGRNKQKKMFQHGMRTHLRLIVISTMKIRLWGGLFHKKTADHEGLGPFRVDCQGKRLTNFSSERLCLVLTIQRRAKGFRGQGCGVVGYHPISLAYLS